MARYFDPDYERRGPGQLAAFLQLPVESVFPIAYDVSSYAQGDSNVLKGTIEAEQTVKLPTHELIALALAGG